MYCKPAARNGLQEESAFSIEDPIDAIDVHPVHLSH